MANGPNTAATKPSNPKESFGEMKLALGLVPDTAITEETLAFLEGALKYGQYNWRIAGVKASTYNRAIRRHLSKWWNGQDRDPLTRVKELASIRACCGILLDAEVCGMLNDDRPPRVDIEAHLVSTADVARHLKELFKDHSPPQYTEREHGKSAFLRHLGASVGLDTDVLLGLKPGRKPQPAKIVPAGTSTREMLASAHAMLDAVKIVDFEERGTRRKPARRFKRPISVKGYVPFPPRPKKRNPTSRKVLDAIVGTKRKPHRSVR